MRRFAYPILTLLATGLLAFGAASAQSVIAQNTVTVRIPAVLRLQIGQGSASDSRAVTFHVVDGRVDKSRLDIQVFANTGWALSVSDEGGYGPSLEYNLGGGAQAWRSPLQQPQVTSGSATGGWRNVPLEVRATPSDAAVNPSGLRTLLFTLAHP